MRDVEQPFPLHCFSFRGRKAKHADPRPDQVDGGEGGGLT